MVGDLANLPEIEYIQIGSQTYALRDNRLDTSLNNKADKDLSNLSDAGKNTVTGLCIPDYSAGTSISAPTSTAPFIATQNCRVLIGVKYTNNGEDTVDIYIDDHHIGGVTARYYNIHFLPIDLKAGNKLKLYYNNAETFLRAYVFPFIGA